MLLLIVSCKKDDNSIDSNFLVWDATFTNEWISSGGENHQTFRNIQYAFSVTDNDDISIGISTDEQSYLYILNEEKEILYESNDSLITQNLSEGLHHLVVATRVPGKSGSFDLYFKGKVENIVQLAFENQSFSDNWINSAASNYQSFRSQHYNLSIPANTYIDVILNTNISSEIYLLQNGNIVEETDDDILSVAINAGEYQLVFSTFSANQSGNFQFEVLGEYDLVEKIETSILSKNGSWMLSGGRNPESPNNPKYSIEVSEDGFIDVLLDTNADAYLYLLNGTSVLLETDDNDFSQFVEAGEYYIVVATFLEGVSADFEITTFGKIESLTEE